MTIKFTRREMLTASVSVAAGAIGLRQSALAKASQPSTPVNFAVPAGACDTHTHIFGDPQQFPMWSGRVYTPETALPDEMHALHQALHMQRVVIVTPSIYGTDNAATLYGMKAYGKGARGVAVIDEKTTDNDLDAMGRAGIKGIRINLATVNQTDASIGRKRLQAAIDRVKARGWHIQMYVAASIIPGIKDLVAASHVPVVFDHFGGAETAKGMQQAGWPELLDLVKSQGVGENLGRLSSVHERPRLRRSGALREGADRRQCRPHRVGQRLAASEFVAASRTQGHGMESGVPDRRRAAVEFAPHMGAGCHGAQEDPGGQSGPAVWFLKLYGF